METLTGVIGKIFYDDPSNDFKVFQLRGKDRSLIRITGEFPVLLSGTKVEIHGNYKSHPKYGVSFSSDAHSFGYDKDVQSVCLYIQSIAKWIGPERSWALANHFGDQLQEVMESTPDRLVEVEGIGEKIAASLAEAWALNRSMRGIRIFLHGLGLSPLKIKKIITMFGPNTEDILKENPWILFEHGFGFTTCDSIASKLDKDMKSPVRFRFFILYLLEQCLSAGHLFLYPQQIIDSFNKYNEKTPYPFKDGTVDLYDIAPHVKELIKEAYIINDSDRLYRMESFFFESESARLLAKIETSKEPSRLSDVDIEEFIHRYEDQERAELKIPDFALSDAQKDAIRSFITDKILIITGGPGVGKTTLVKALVQLMKITGISFELLTPTGIAAKKLGSTAGSDAYTIHRRLGYKGSKWDYNSLNKYSTQVVITDECSMVDMEVFYRLVSALYANTRLVFVGDVDQLPSVGPGSVLKGLIESKQIKIIVLDKIFRQDKCSDIIKEAKKIRDGDTDMTLFGSDKSKDIWHIRERDHAKIEKLIVKFAGQLKDSIKTKGNKLAFQIITPRNQGDLSVDELNVALQGALNPPDKDKKEVRINNSIIRKGDRVIIRKNNYELGVFNGDIGKASFITQDHIVVDLEDFYDESRRVEIPMKIADEMIKLAYCITVHRCVPWHSRISTISGMKKIKNVNVGDLVYSTGGFRKVLWHGRVGFKDTVVINTRSGLKVYGAEDHKFLMPDNGYKNLKDLKINDFLCIPLEVIPGGPVPINHTNTFFRNFKKSISLPSCFDEDLCWLLGVLIGDGNYTDEDDGTVEIAGKCKLEILNRAQKILEGYGLRVCDHFKKGRLTAKYVCSRNFRDWLLSIGIEYVTAREKSVPDVIFQASKECRAAFVAGLIDTDGCHDKRSVIRYTTASERLSLDLQQLLLMHGVVSSRRLERGEPEISYKVIVSGMGYDKIARILKLTMVGKAKRLEKYSVKLSEKSNHYEIPLNDPVSTVNKFLDAFRASEGPSRGIKGKGLFSKYKKLFTSLHSIKKGVNKLRKPVLESMKEVSEKEKFPLPREIQDIIDRGYYYDPIVSIEACSKEEMYDIEVEGEHSYVTQGALCHNSQGQEYPLVIMPLIKAHGALLLQRNLLYTAITRAKKKVIIIGEASAIEAAIKNNKIQKRNTRFAERIIEWTQGNGISMRDMFSNSSTYQNSAILERLLSLEGSGE